MNQKEGGVQLRHRSEYRPPIDCPADQKRRERASMPLDQVNHARDSALDVRIKIVEELLASEIAYYDCLRTVFHTYANPLSKWGLTGQDHNMLFGGLEKLLHVVEAFIRQLRDSVAPWDPRTSKIGGVLCSIGSFWTDYECYCFSHRQLLRRLKEKEKNATFKAFLEVRKASSHSRLSLEALLTLPIERVPEYHRLLRKLLDTMEHDHSDFDHLSDAAGKASQLVQRRQEEAVFLENQIKLAQVQDRFSQNLYLNLPLDCVDADGRKKKSSLPSYRHGSHNSHGTVAVRRNGGVRAVHKASPAVIRAWKGSPVRATVRTYVKEGAVQFRSGYSHQDRYLVLFSDLLLVAKSNKSHNNFKLKQRLRLSEMWLADCLEEVSETSQKGELSFVLGWPTTNTVATFGSKEDRDAWHSQLSRYINKQRDMVEPRSVSLKVYNRAIDTVNSPQFQIVNVDHKDTTQDVVSMALETLGVKEDPKGYQLWVISGKDESAYPLIGHEFPYAIKLNHIRQTLDSVENDQLRHISKHNQCQFILKKRKKTHTTQSSTPRRFLYKSIKKSPFKWAAKWRTGTPQGSQERLDCSQLFGTSLSKVAKDGQLPKSILMILVRLYKEGPSVPGVFRRSCNARLARELRDALNNGEDASIEGADILVLATIMKEFLRSLPDCIFCCDNYEDLLATNREPDESNKIDGICCVLHQLPIQNYVVLQHFIWVLYRVAENCQQNCMDAHNISLCVSPSLLWTADSMASVHHDVPLLIEFMVRNCVQIFGREVPSAFTAGKRLVRVRSESAGSNKYQVNVRKGSVSSTEMEYEESGDDAASPQSSLSKDSALTASDSNLFSEHEQCGHEKRGSVQTSGDATRVQRQGSAYSQKSNSGYGSHLRDSDAVEKRKSYIRSNSADIRASTESLNETGGSLPSSLPDEDSFFAGDLPASGSMPSLCDDDDEMKEPEAVRRSSIPVRRSSIPTTYSTLPTSPTMTKGCSGLPRRQTPPTIPPATRRLPGQPPAAPNLVERKERPGGTNQGHTDGSKGWSQPLRQNQRSPVARRKNGMSCQSMPSSPETGRILENKPVKGHHKPPSYDWAVEQVARKSPGSMSHYVRQSWQADSVPESLSLDVMQSNVNSLVDSSPSPMCSMNNPMSSTSYKSAKSRFYVPASYTTVVTAEVSSGSQRKPSITTVIHPIVHVEGSPQPTKKRSMFYHRVSTSGPSTLPTRGSRAKKGGNMAQTPEGINQNNYYRPEDDVAAETSQHRSSTFSSVRARSRDESLSAFAHSTDISDFKIGHHSRHQTAPGRRSTTEPNTPVGSYKNESYLTSSSVGASPLLSSKEHEEEYPSVFTRKHTRSYSNATRPHDFRSTVRRIKSVDQLREQLDSSGVDSSPLPDRKAVMSIFERHSSVNNDSPSSQPFHLKTDITGRYVGIPQNSARGGLNGQFSKLMHHPLQTIRSMPERRSFPVRSRTLPLQHSFDSAMDDRSPDEEFSPEEERNELFSGMEESYV